MLLVIWGAVGVVILALIALLRLISREATRGIDERNSYEYWRSVRDAEVLSRSKGPLV